MIVDRQENVIQDQTLAIARQEDVIQDQTRAIAKLTATIDRQAEVIDQLQSNASISSNFLIIFILQRDHCSIDYIRYVEYKTINAKT